MLQGRLSLREKTKFLFGGTMGVATVAENASELNISIGNYSSVSFNLVADIKQGNLGLQISTGLAISSGNFVSSGVQPAFLSIANPVIDDGILNAGTRTFDVAISGTVNGRTYSDIVTVTVVDDEVGKSIIRGTEGRDTDLGTSGADVINSLGGNDRINATNGDFIDGGAGLDTVVLPGFGWQFPNAAGAVWSILNFNGWQVGFTNVERLQTNFASITAFDVDGTAGAVYRVYQAAFARKPDIGGVSY